MTYPWPQTSPQQWQLDSLSQAEPAFFWLDGISENEIDTLGSSTDADLCVVGGGYTGLWAAIHAKTADPNRDVVVIDSEVCGFGASSRNGGFCSYSLTHGLSNGLSRFPNEIDRLETLGLENFAGFKNDLSRLGIDCNFEHNGELTVINEPYQQEILAEVPALLRQFGHQVEVLDDHAIRLQVDSPTYLGGFWDKTGSALLHPGKLLNGLYKAALKLGVRIYEETPALDLWEENGGIVVMTPSALVRCRKAIFATGAYDPLLRKVKRYVAPVYDYALVTQPLTKDQLNELGWVNRQGVSDCANRFHYYRLTPDNRVLFGGYDAIYKAGGKTGPERDQHQPTFEKLAQHFFTVFPQLAGISFTHKWGGPIDTCSRLSVFFGTEFSGKVSYAAGYTGLGVGASRFGARVALGLVDGDLGDLASLEMVKTQPKAFPPGPLRSAVIGITQNRLAAADLRQGREGIWLKTLAGMGISFDS